MMQSEHHISSQSQAQPALTSSRPKVSPHTWHTLGTSVSSVAIARSNVVDRAAMTSVGHATPSLIQQLLSLTILEGAQGW